MIRREHEIQATISGRPSEFVTLMIPNNFVTKIIGVGGCVIREIAVKSGGALITINSDKRSEKILQNCPVKIAGALACKQDATCLLISELQTLKLANSYLFHEKFPNNPAKHDLQRDDRSSSEEVGLIKRETLHSKFQNEPREEITRRHSTGMNLSFQDNRPRNQSDTERLLDLEPDLWKGFNPNMSDSGWPRR